MLARGAANGAGLGSDGAFFPRSNLSMFDWRWMATVPVPGVPVPAGGPTGGQGWRIWVGDVDAGLFLKLKGSDVSWNRQNGGTDLNPQTWANAGQGGIRVSFPAIINAYTGTHTLNQTTSMLFNFSMMATPTKGDYISSAEGKQEHYVKSRHFHW